MTQYAPVFPGFFSQAEPAAAPTPVPASDRRLDVLLARVEAKANTDTSGFSIAAARFILQYRAESTGCDRRRRPGLPASVQKRASPPAQAAENPTGEQSQEAKEVTHAR